MTRIGGTVPTRVHLRREVLPSPPLLFAPRVPESACSVRVSPAYTLVSRILLSRRTMAEG